MNSRPNSRKPAKANRVLTLYNGRFCWPTAEVAREFLNSPQRDHKAAVRCYIGSRARSPAIGPMGSFADSLENLTSPVDSRRRMRLKLSDWASIAEVVSGIAVVISLIFLIVGIRENTEITRAAAYDRNVDGLIAFRADIARDDELAQLWLAYESGKSAKLEGIDRLQLNNLINLAFGNYEKAYFNRKYGVLGESEWTRYERQICINLERLKDLPDLKADMATVVTDEFAEYMEDLCGTE
jgi:hypothetical protein